MVVERRRASASLHDGRVHSCVYGIRRQAWLRHRATQVKHLPGEDARLSHGHQRFRCVKVYLRNERFGGEDTRNEHEVKKILLQLRVSSIA